MQKPKQKCRRNSTPTNKSKSATSKLKPRIINLTPARENSYLGYLDVARKARKSIKPGMCSSYQPDLNVHCRLQVFNRLNSFIKNILKDSSFKRWLLLARLHIILCLKVSYIYIYGCHYHAFVLSHFRPNSS